jgi:predicted RNA-binding protein YlqC (UPF0109 family)
MPYREQVRVMVEIIAVNLVDRCSEVSVSLRQSNEDATVVVLRVAPEEIGKIIGKKGIMARSIRNMLCAISTKNHHRFDLNIQP